MEAEPTGRHIPIKVENLTKLNQCDILCYPEQGAHIQNPLRVANAERAAPARHRGGAEAAHVEAGIWNKPTVILKLSTSNYRQILKVKDILSEMCGRTVE